MPFWHEESQRIPMIHKSALLNVNTVYNCTTPNEDDLSSVLVRGSDGHLR